MPHPFSTRGTAIVALDGNKTWTADDILESTIMGGYNPGSATRDIALPDPADCEGITVFAANAGSSGGTVAFTDDGGTVAAVGDGKGVSLFSDGNRWYGVS